MEVVNKYTKLKIHNFDSNIPDSFINVCKVVQQTTEQFQCSFLSKQEYW